MSKAKEPRLQTAALPWRRRDGLEILLVSSRETKRWVIPKGWPIPGLDSYVAAAREAFEEAGVRGGIDPGAIGHFHYIKRRKDGAGKMCRVEVFTLKVESQAEDWPEKAERTTRWFPAATAAELVQEPELKVLIRRFDSEPPNSNS